MTAAILHELGRANLSDATALMMAFGEGGGYGDSNFMPPMAGAGVAAMRRQDWVAVRKGADHGS